MSDFQFVSTLRVLIFRERLRYQKHSNTSEKSKNFIEKGVLQLYAPMRYKIEANFSIFKIAGFSVFVSKKLSEMVKAVPGVRIYF